MAKVTRESLVKRVFSDPKNYPYGFSRSGDFSISESKALSHYGCLISALVDGQIEPSTQEDEELLEAVFGNREAQSCAEKAWLKYQKRINRPKLGNIYGTSRITSIDDDESEDISEDSELEIED